jgi:hypothetical protein
MTRQLFLAMVLLAAISVPGLVIVKRCDTPGFARSVAGPYQSVLGRYLAVADDSAGVLKLLPYGDVADSVFCDRFSTKGSALNVAASGGPGVREMFVADGDSGLQVFQSDSGTAWGGPDGYALPGVTRTVARVDSTVFVAGDSGLFALACTSGSYWQWHPLSLVFSERSWCLGAEDIAAESHYVYVLAGAGSRIVKCNVERPESTTVELVVPAYHDTCALAVLRDTAYVVSYSRFAILQMDTVGRPAGSIIWQRPAVGERWLPGHGEAITLSGNRAYISVSNPTSPEYNTVLVYDITNRTAPVLVDSLRYFPGIPGGIAVDGDFVYVAAGDSGVVVLREMALAARTRPRATAASAVRTECLRDSRGLVLRLTGTDAIPRGGRVVRLDGSTAALLVWQREAGGEWVARGTGTALASGAYCVVAYLDDGGTVSHPVVASQRRQP